MPKKITVFKKVYWRTASRQMSGRVKQILSDHVVVSSDGTDYIVSKRELSLEPKAREEV